MRCGRFENFESDHHYESNPKSEVRFEIESNLEASQVPTYYVYVVCDVKLSSRSLAVSVCLSVCLSVSLDHCRINDAALLDSVACTSCCS